MTTENLNQSARSLYQAPTLPDGKWFKSFGGLTPAGKAPRKDIPQADASCHRHRGLVPPALRLLSHGG
jgi:hypothetical protein